MDLTDYRRQNVQLYSQVRDSSLPPQARWELFRRGRDELFRAHPQSALTEADRRSFKGLDYFDYSPELRYAIELESVEKGKPLSVQLEDDGEVVLSRVGRARLRVGDVAASLMVYWIEGYGGGMFLPFRDGTNGGETYGGGRYLLDSTKGADLGAESGKLVLDFNYAYNPSCAYNPRWHCPLAPVENWLEIPIAAGELSFKSSEIVDPDPDAVPR
jgi:uncharacterized protein (DUF1684 family)